MCHVSHVICHLSLTPTVSDTDPRPANSPAMHTGVSLLARNGLSKSFESIWMY